MSSLTLSDFFPSVSLHCLLSCLSLLFSETLHLIGVPFLFSLVFTSLLSWAIFAKPPQTTSLPSCISFSLGRLCLLPPIQYYEPLSIVLQVHWLLELILWIYSSPPLYIHKGFKSYPAGLVVLCVPHLLYIVHKGNYSFLSNIPYYSLWVIFHRYITCLSIHLSMNIKDVVVSTSWQLWIVLKSRRF